MPCTRRVVRVRAQLPSEIMRRMKVIPTVGEQEGALWCRDLPVFYRVSSTMAGRFVLVRVAVIGSAAARKPLLLGIIGPLTTATLALAGTLLLGALICIRILLVLAAMSGLAVQWVCRFLLALGLGRRLVMGNLV